MTINSRRKGARFERHVAGWFRSLLGNDARRGRQYSGSPESPDVVHCISGCHVECKAVERLNVRAAMEQAARDAGPAEVPVVIHKKNNGPTMLTIRLEDYVAFVCHAYGDLINAGKSKEVPEAPQG